MYIMPKLYGCLNVLNSFSEKKHAIKHLISEQEFSPHIAVGKGREGETTLSIRAVLEKLAGESYAQR